METSVLSESATHIPQPLQDAIANNNLIPLIGAGVSMSITDNQGERVFPSWQGLLERAAQALKADDPDSAMIVQGCINKKKWQNAAEQAHEGLEGPQWKSFLTDQFAPDYEQLNQVSKQLPRAIWQLSNRIITLNYDKIMHWGHTQSAKFKLLDNHADAELADFASVTSTPQVWHLHGRIDNIKDLVLTPLSYQKLYEQTPTAALTAFKTLCRQQNLLFIGCSLDDAELLEQINQP